MTIQGLLRMYTKPVFTEKKDGNRTFKTAYSNITSKSVVTLNISAFSGKNVIVEGNPKISVREGDSKHGEELVFELLRTGPIREEPRNSAYDTIEIYMPKEFGIKFLEDALEYFKKHNSTRLEDLEAFM